MNLPIPLGFRFGAVHCGIKRNAAKEDMSLIVCDRPAVAAGVYTQNAVVAAPVTLDRSRTPTDDIRTVVVNSGNANACTGKQGDADAETMARLAAEVAGAEFHQSLVMSTGIIGEPLPMEKVAAGIRDAATNLGDDAEHLQAAARGILTTDLVTKVAGRELTLADQTIRIAGIAKGSGMIAPNMATMLAVVMTDAALTPILANAALEKTVVDSFNAISVDGHTSTNDTALLLASGAAGGEPLEADDYESFCTALDEVCQELARAVADDGEGATHLITIDVDGCETRCDARTIAKAVADSPLVKTAIAGADPNWGRIVSAAGYSGVRFAPSGVSLELNGVRIYECGGPVAFDAVALSQSIRENRNTSIVLRLSEGNARTTFWTCDLTVEYVHINADYHT